MDKVIGAGDKESQANYSFRPAGVPSPRRSGWLLALAGASICGLAVMLYLFNPAQYGFYPRCMLYVTTGWQCPGCGGLRALHALLHGEIAQAFRWNPLLFVLLPLLTYLGIRELAWLLWRKEWPLIFKNPAWAWLLLVAIVLFVILRNLPLGPFAWFKG